ncbi:MULTISPECIES: endonuclease III [Dehalobacter]|uniref:Endonuclease III n=2 Tax=Dehalobacter restrictus TaxID=55583 RepID=A0A857DKJ6_9FIRM|nr:MULTISPECIES: endonuclease III [Dehalobacter]AHF09718.1 endonuclease III [Dehalobacter restrictus DSM 9455]MCG1025373.1 endonuclease III [Dehalobacter sp.]OCZ52733.1 endonuclease III [Dehalobacter sp. TeCB1]QHA01890.1 endonuclease III [Dehalobacter restrictus]
MEPNRLMMRDCKINRILCILEQTYPEAHCELNFRNPFELLVATILSAQTTDQKVNKVTAVLFERCPTPKKMLEITPREFEEIIRPIGLFRTKAKNILQTCELLIEEHHGDVPSNLDDLVKMPGVGRKTAGVVLANAYGIPALPVDTHVLRVANRLGLSREKDPSKVEKELTALIPMELWIDTHHRLIFHGRRLCHARKPECPVCPLKDCCPVFTSAS